MRDIKFRAWNTQEQRMLLGYPNPENQHFYEIVGSTYPGMGTDFRVLEIMQYTGLTDRNSDWYEGDIIARGERRAVIAFVQGEFVATGPEGMGRLWQYVHAGFEVIGNIYANPDLIPGGPESRAGPR
jgi:hypothetical protein